MDDLSSLLNGIKRDANDTPQSLDAAAVPLQTATAPKDANSAPQGTATPPPQGTATAPHGTATPPQGTATAPQGTATAPQGTATPPATNGESSAKSPTVSLSDGNVVYQGSQADVFIQDGKVLKVYKRGCGYNAVVLPLVKKLKGKDYLVDLYDFGVMDYQGERRQFELMEYCPAGAVSGFNLKGNKEVILKIAVKTALALDACHRTGFIHKDVKPANILIRNKTTWDCVLCDFGIADVLDGGKVTTVQARTPIYAAPEVYERTVTIENKTYCELAPAADFYSLGMTILCLWYGESTFLSKEAVMAIQKVHDGIVVPADMPDPLNTITRGLLVKDPAHRWGLREIEDFMKGKKVEVYEERTQGGLNIVFNSSKDQVAHSPEELATFMVDDMNLAIKYLYSGKISKWLESIPELQVEIEKIIEEDYPNDQTMGVLAAIHLLNPFYDPNLCCDLHHSNYAMTGETIGRLLNNVYYLYYTKYGTDYNAMLRGFDDTDRQLVHNANIVYELAYSFENDSNAEYLPWFFDHKGNRFEKQRKWFDYCLQTLVESKKKAGPKGKRYLNEVAMMKTIAGFGAVPEYRLSRTGEVLRSLADFQAAPEKELRYDLQNDKGLRGWLAVQCHENPNADLKKKFNYEKLLEKYLDLIGSVDDNDREYKRFIQAREEAQNISFGAKNQIRSTWTVSFIQKVLISVLAVLPLTLLVIDIILNLIDNPVLDMSHFEFKWVFYILGIIAAGISYFLMDADGCIVPIIIGAVVSFAIILIIKFVGWIIVWLYLLIALAVLVFFSIKTLFASSPFKQKTNTIMNPGFEELTLEPLHYAFSNESHFDSSLNGVVDENSINRWKKDVNKRWLAGLMFVGCTVVLVFFRFLLPSSERMDRFDRGIKSKIGSYTHEETIDNDTIGFEEAVEEVPVEKVKSNLKKK